MESTSHLYAVDRNVYAYRCPKCGTLYHPAPMVCRKCRTRLSWLASMSDMGASTGRWDMT